MNTKRHFGVLTAVAGAALALGSLTFGGSATATESSNDHDHDYDYDYDHDNVKVCPSGYTRFEAGIDRTALFHWAVTADNKYVAITQISPTVTGLTAYVKGGNAYRVYSPVIDGELMRAPRNDGGNIPTLSHWFLCYKVTPVVTTTTIPEMVTTTTTIPEIVTTTTIPAPVYSYNLTSMCRPSETEGSLRIRNGSPTDQAYTLALYGGATLSGTAAPGDTLVTVPWSSSADTWILTIDGRNITKAIGNNPACDLPPTTTVPPTTTTLPEIVTTTTIPEIVTTTTIGESGGPTTTAAATTTTEQASEGPTTTLVADEGDDLPTTGGGTPLLLVLGLAMLGGGMLFTLLGRTTRES